MLVGDVGGRMRRRFLRRLPKGSPSLFSQLPAIVLRLPAGAGSAQDVAAAHFLLDQLCQQGKVFISTEPDPNKHGFLPQ